MLFAYVALLFVWKSPAANVLHVGSITAIVSVEVAEHAAPVPVIVYVEALISNVGVPVIAPVLEFKLKPVGNAGLTLKEVPVVVGVIDEIA